VLQSVDLMGRYPKAQSVEKETQSRRAQARPSVIKSQRDELSRHIHYRALANFNGAALSAHRCSSLCRVRTGMLRALCR